MKKVRAKKKLGQHFLKDLSVSQKIAQTLPQDETLNVLEIGPGMGMLTQFLIQQSHPLKVVEIDSESVAYLQAHYPFLTQDIVQEDILKLDFQKLYGTNEFAVIGNFPYNISSQIVFKVLSARTQIPFFAGMFQKEVAQRLCEPPGSKQYGILSVLVQLFYETSYLFEVPPEAFNPPPKVHSAVIQCQRKDNFSLDCDEALLFQIVKLSFQQRRKTLRNSLKTLAIPENIREDSIFDLRPEKLSGASFVELTKRISDG
ncbi:MAG: 16S rRNA (adenine(1518)-N(6)/adenine(1519)-N(6))-dimethyltransferase RsmA [Flavobacteriaceae bacterium]